MTRPIDADILKEAINTWDKFACLPNGILEPFRNLEHPEMFEPYIHFRDIIKAIDNAPTVDTDLSGYSKRLWKAAYERGKKEKQQGEWIKEDKLWGGFGDRVLVLTCSECGKSFIYRGNNPKFCSECGADIREEA